MDKVHEGGGGLGFVNELGAGDIRVGIAGGGLATSCVCDTFHRAMEESET